MDSDDELRDLLGNKHQENQFSFDKDNWEKLATELKEERKNKKRLIVFLSFIGLLIGFTGVYLLNYKNKQNTESSLASNKLTPSLQAVNDKMITASKDSQASSKDLNITKESSVKTKTGPKNPGQNSDKKTKIKPEAPVQDSNEKIKGDISVPEKIKPGKTQFNSENTGPDKFVAVKAEKTFTSEKAQSEERKNDKELNSIDQPNVKQNNPETVLTKEHESREEAKPANVLQVPENNSEDSRVKQENAISKNEDIDSVLTIKNNEPSSESNEKELLSKTEPTVSVQKPDSTLATPLLTNDSAAKKPANTIFSFDVGTDYLFGWKKEAKGLNPVIGFTYYNAITPKVGLSIGVQYTSVNNLSATSHTSANTKLKFGEESDVTKISASKMYYLIIPLKLNYAINKNNFVAIGYNVGVLFDVKSKVETYTERFDSRSNYQVSTAMGYRSGFNNFDGQVSLSYRRRLYKELFISGELFYGLRDIKDNAVYKSAVFERNSGFKLMLSFNFLKK